MSTPQSSSLDSSASGDARFLYDVSPESVGARIDDDDRVQACLDATVEYYQQQLSDTMRSLITGRWGITSDTINDVGIGYVGDGNSLVTHLQNAGFSPLTMIRSGVVAEGVAKHVYSCDPSECRHNFSELDSIAERRENGELDPEDINLKAVIEWADQEGKLWLRDWWDNRIVFPYKDAEGAHRYMIARRTEQTDDRPGKYIKQSVKKPWVNDHVVHEPLYGANTVADDEPLIVTEGITDAIMAHQHGYRAITPATTRVKDRHLSKLVRLARRANPVYILNDNEESDAGLKGAIEIAAQLEVNDIDPRIAELPRPDTVESIDLAAFLRDNNPDKLQQYLEAAPIAEDHEKYDEYAPDDTDPDTTADGVTIARSRGHVESRISDESDMDSSYGSAIYALSLDDVCGVEPGYRGDNPVRHVGSGHSNYFSVFKEATDDGVILRAYDHKTDHGYNALTWLACASGARSTASPAGSLNRAETWETWRYTKEQGFIPGDDSVPAKAILHVAEKHDIVPSADIPRDDDGRLDPEDYDDTLEFIEEELGIDPGRPTITR